MSEFNYTHDKENFKIRVKTPYDKNFVEKARNLRGSWDKKTSEWVFDDSIEDYVKETLIDVYGTTGEEPVEMVSLVVNLHYDCCKHNAVSLFGRTIAIAFGRDSGAKLGDGIVWLSGEYKSSGSVKNWYTEIRNAHFEIQNFAISRTLKEDVQHAIKEGWCIVKPSVRKRKREEIESNIKKYEKIILKLKQELNNI